MVLNIIVSQYIDDEGRQNPVIWIHSSTGSLLKKDNLNGLLLLM